MSFSPDRGNARGNVVAQIAAKTVTYAGSIMVYGFMSPDDSRERNTRSALVKFDVSSMSSEFRLDLLKLHVLYSTDLVDIDEMQAAMRKNPDRKLSLSKGDLAIVSADVKHLRAEGLLHGKVDPEKDAKLASSIEEFIDSRGPNGLIVINNAEYARMKQPHESDALEVLKAALDGQLSPGIGVLGKGKLPKDIGEREMSERFIDRFSRIVLVDRSGNATTTPEGYAATSNPAVGRVDYRPSKNVLSHGDKIVVPPGYTRLP